MKKTICILILLCASAVSARDLTLKDAVELTLKQNLGLQVDRLSLQAGRFSLDGAKGVFDPLLGANLRTSSQESPSTWQLQGADVYQSDNAAYDFSLSQLLPTGGKYSLDWSNGRTESNSSYYYLNPSYSSGLTLSLSQPFLKGFGTDIANRPVLSARYSYNQSLSDFRRSLESKVLEVETAYWNLHFAQEDLVVKQKDLELAQEFLKITQRKIEVGTEAPINVYSAQVGVAVREEAIIGAEAALKNAQDAMAKLLHLEQAQWNDPLVAVEAPDTEALVPAEGTALETAFAKRPELVRLGWQSEQQRLALLTAKNALLPALDLSFSYGFSGVGGDYVVRDAEGNIVEVLPGGWNDAWKQVTKTDYPNWSAALVFSLPLGNRSAKADKRSAEVGLELLAVQEAQLKESILAEVRAALRSVETARKSLTAAQESQLLAEKNLEAERKRYDNGLSTNYQVLLVQKDLSEASTRRIQAASNLRKTFAACQYTLGALLEFEGVEVEVPEYDTAGLRGPKFLRYGNYVD